MKRKARPERNLPHDACGAHPAQRSARLTDLSLSRRSFVSAASVLLLSACSEALETISEDVTSSVFGKEGDPISRDRVNSIPYATMAAKVGKGPWTIIVLGRVNNKELQWFSGDRTTFVTRNGRVIRTAGLPANLRRTELLAQDRLSELATQPSDQGEASLRRLVDIEPPYRYGVLIRSKLEVVRDESIEIAELVFETRLIRETCRARELDWRFENLYWVSPKNGLLWKSVQHLHPDLPAVKLELLRPASV